MISAAPAAGLKDRVDEMFSAACQGAPAVARFSAGGGMVRVEAATEGLLRAVTAAIQRMQPGRGEADLVIRVWEMAEGFSGPAMGDEARVQLRQSTEANGCVAWTDPGAESSVVLDLAAGEAYCALRSLATWPAWEKAAPFRAILEPWLVGRGHMLAHAAAIARDERALLLAGPGGSGKSTTALLAATSGWDHYADDYTLLEWNEGAPRVHPLYNTAKLTPRSAEFFPGLEFSTVADGEKRVVELPRWKRAALGREPVPLAGIVFPTTAGSERRETPAVRPLPGGEALRLLAPSSILQLATGGGKSLAALAALVRSVPCWRLELTPDPGEIVRCLGELISHRA